MTKKLIGNYNTTKQFFENGYAIPLYGTHTHLWVHFDKEVVLPHGALEITTINDVPCALWTDILEAAKEKA
jgi:hypothetical protein